ncbi:MAG: hypothetical protein Hals2KO_21810 [Halioglobus sp.]
MPVRGPRVETVAEERQRGYRGGAMSDKGFDPDWASPPWHTIQDVIAEREMPEAVFVSLLGLTPSGLEKLQCGDMAITSLFAAQLASILGSSKEFWLNREIQYRYARNKLDAQHIADLEAKVSAP